MRSGARAPGWTWLIGKAHCRVLETTSAISVPDLARSLPGARPPIQGHPGDRDLPDPTRVKPQLLATLARPYRGLLRLWSPTRQSNPKIRAEALKLTLSRSSQ